MMRYFIAIGSPECPNLGLPRLERVESDVEEVERILGAESQGYSRALSKELPPGAPSSVIGRELGDWFLDEARTEDDCVVLYIAGHGDSHGQFGAHCLLTSDTKPRAIHLAVKTEDLIEWIFAAARYPRSVLLVLDVCFAGQGAGEVIAAVGTSLRKAFPSGAGLWIVATADRNTEAYDGAFVRAWQAVMRDETGAWLPRGGKKHLHPGDFVLALNSHLGTTSRQRVVLFCMSGPNEPSFIKNPRYTPGLDGLEVDLVTHWTPKALGDDTIGGTRSYFTGRRLALAACRAWLRSGTSDGRARAVTGAMGSGKSAVLGQVVLDPGNGAPPLARVNARGQQTEDVVTSISRQLGYTAIKAGLLMAELAARPETVGIVVDSLDEAASPSQLERDLLRGLAACPMVRLIVGMRSSVGKRALGGVAVEFDLDSPEYFCPADVEGYAFALLRTSDGERVGYAAEAATGAAREVAKFVAERAGRSFLYARLACRGLGAAKPVDTTVPHWRAALRLPDSIEAMFGADLDRFETETRQRFIDMLIPLAYARRRGLPQKHIWAAVASRISGKQYTNANIRDLKERAGFYLIQDTEDEETVYRLFHQSFTDYLKNLSKDAEVEAQFTAALADLVADAGGWATIREPYLLTAFPSHAASAGRLGQALTDAAFLVVVRPQGLLPELHKISDPHMWPLAQAYRQASHWFAAGKPKEGARYLMLAVLKYNSRVVAEQLSELYEEGSRWWPQWARWRGMVAGWIAVEADGPITALCTSQDSIGDPLAVCGHDDGSVSIWRLESGARMITYHPPGETAPVRSLAIANCQGEQVVVGAWASGCVRALRQATGETTGHWRSARCDGLWRPTNVVTIQGEGRPLAAIGDNKELLLFELPTLSVRSRRAGAAKAGLYNLALARRNNRTVIVTGGDTVEDGASVEEHTIRVWDIDGLMCLQKGGGDLSVARWLVAFEEGNESHVLVGEGMRAVALRVADLGRAGPQLDSICRLSVVYSADAHAVIFGSEYGRLEALAARRHSPDLLELRSVPTKADAPGSLWSTIVELGGRPAVLSAEGTQVRVWDVIELLGSGESPDMDSRAGAGVLSLAARSDLMFLGTEAGSVLACDRFGNQLWSTDLTTGGIRCLAVGADGAELMVGTTDGMIHRLDTSTGSQRHTALAAGSGVRALVVVPTARGQHLFAATELRASNGYGLYFARVWSLPDATEIPTWNSEAGPEALLEDSKWSKEDDWGANGFRPELALGGYYRWKPLFAMSAFECGERTVVALAGPHGEVRVMDAGTLKEMRSWIGGSSGNYVHCLFGGVLGGSPHVFGGDETGVLFRGGVEEVDFRKRSRAHKGSVSALTLRNTPHGGLLVSGGRDGWVRFWNRDLESIDEFDAGRPVASLVWMGDYLVVATDRGVLCVRVQCEARPKE